MAAKASDWLDEARAQRELQIAPNHPDAALLPPKIASAVTWAAQWMGWPLIDEYVDFDTAGPTERLIYPLPSSSALVRLGYVMFPVKVDSVSYWPSGSEDADNPMPFARLENDLLVPDIGRFDAAPISRQESVVRIYPPPAGWPQDMRRLRIRLVRGVSPATFPFITDGIVLILRALYEGNPVMERKPAFERLLEPFRLRV